MYYYVKNIQGDIIKIVSSTGAVVANYAYNVWGELLYIKDAFGNSITDTSSIAYLNPFRYRGYVYDDETGLYYLQSRYYDPVTCRFINADSYCDTLSGNPLSSNMYAYCENNAINKIDKTGDDAWWVQAEGSVYSMGHTSLLIEEKKNYWWFLYWGPSSIQLFFLGNPDEKRLNETLKRTIEVFNKKYPILNLPTPDKYTKALVFSGNFYSSFIEARYLFKAREYYNKTKIYTLRFNPYISRSEYKELINGRTLSALSKDTHRYYTRNRNLRPESMVIWGNEDSYDWGTFNCMHMSALILRYGTSYKNNDLFQKEMNITFFLDYYPPTQRYFELFFNGKIYSTSLAVR